MRHLRRGGVPEELPIDTMVVSLRSAQHEGERLVSRAQAKRLSRGFVGFERVELDFAGVPDIGQAFADELFRVFASAHPEIRMARVNAEPAVEQMIRRVLAPRAARDRGGQVT